MKHLLLSGKEVQTPGPPSFLHIARELDFQKLRIMKDSTEEFVVIIEKNSGACLLVVIFIARIEHLDPHFLAWLGLSGGDSIANL